MENAQNTSLAPDIITEFRRLRKAGLIPLHGDFFPSVHYPPITMYHPLTEEQLFEGYKAPEDNLFVIYAHIPFCIQQCVFCHYPVKCGELREEKDLYLDTIEKEIRLYKSRLGISVMKARSALIGGGTPTYLSTDQLRRFLESLTQTIDFSRCSQFSYDVDPSTLLGSEGSERLKIMRACGVDRLTIGIQSLDDDILKKMNRDHNQAQAIQAIEASQKAGFKLNIEFIFGYPGQTQDNWAEVIKQATTLGVEEIQLYRLKISPYGDKKGFILAYHDDKPQEFPSTEETLLMKKRAIDILGSKGYHENLTRVFTKDIKDFSHYAADQCCNLMDQVGFGLTAFNSLRDRFGLNTQNFEEYYSALREGHLPVNRGLVRTVDDQARWALVLPLKNRKVFKAVYQNKTGLSLNEVFRTKIELLKANGLLQEDAASLSLTPLGRFFADEVCLQFHHPNDMPFPKKDYTDGELNPYNHQP